MSATEKVEMETAFLLHARDYRESSRILEVFSQHHGRVGLVARGARRPKSRWGNVLRPFQPLHLSWFGRGSLHTLKTAEPSSVPVAVNGMRLMSGYYLNELLLSFIRRGDPHPELFAHYTTALVGLAEEQNTETPLRRFEIALLREIGYGLILDHDAENGEPLDPDRQYQYMIERGPVPLVAGQSMSMAEGLVFSGEQLMAIDAGGLIGEDDLRCAKRLLRAVLHHYLDGRPLKTREVLAAMRV